MVMVKWWDGDGEMDPMRWILRDESYKLDPTRWILQDGSYKMDPTRWILQDGSYKMDPTRWILRYGSTRNWSGLPVTLSISWPNMPSALGLVLAEKKYSIKQGHHVCGRWWAHFQASDDPTQTAKRWEQVGLIRHQSFHMIITVTIIIIIIDADRSSANRSSQHQRKRWFGEFWHFYFFVLELIILLT